MPGRNIFKCNIELLVVRDLASVTSKIPHCITQGWVHSEAKKTNICNIKHTTNSQLSFNGIQLNQVMFTNEACILTGECELYLTIIVPNSA